MRQLLQSILALTVVLPIIILNLYAIQDTAAPAGAAEKISEIITIGTPLINIAETISDSTIATWITSCARVHCATAAILLIFLLASIIRILTIKMQSASAIYQTHRLSVHGNDSLSPFAWGGWIFVSRKDLTDKNQEMIISHENAHNIHRHWIDNIAARLVCILQWFNPAAWLLEKELKNVHEFQADSCVINEGFDAHAYQMVIIEKAVGSRFASVANSLNHSSLNKRITMMLSSKKRQPARLRAVAAAGIASAAVLLMSTDVMANAINRISQQGYESEMPDKVKDFSTKITNPAPAASTTEQAKPDKLPQYPGGTTALLQHVLDNMKYPASAIDAEKQGVVTVQFIIDKNGNVKNPEILKGVCPELDKEAIRVVKTINGWEPGTSDGKPVDCSFVLPITFRLKK